MPGPYDVCQKVIHYSGHDRDQPPQGVAHRVPGFAKVRETIYIKMIGVEFHVHSSMACEIDFRVSDCINDIGNLGNTEGGRLTNSGHNYPDPNYCGKSV